MASQAEREMYSGVSGRWRWSAAGSSIRAWDGSKSRCLDRKNEEQVKRLACPLAMVCEIRYGPADEMKSRWAEARSRRGDCPPTSPSGESLPPPACACLLLLCSCLPARLRLPASTAPVGLLPASACLLSALPLLQHPHHSPPRTPASIPPPHLPACTSPFACCCDPCLT